ncbi:MAG: hypothetical protein KAX49_15745 [Halanaerobiales bacterium]|nr:hypothetical protein [Halanaerobiales bacterium]
MESLGDLGLNIKIDWQKVNASLKKIQNATKKTSTKIARTMKSIGSSIRTISKISFTVSGSIFRIFSKTFSRIYQTVKRTMFLIGAAMAGFGIYGAKLAISAGEVENLMKVSFGNMRGYAEEWVERFAGDLGLYKPAVKDYVATLNIMTKAMGIADDESLKMSANLTKRAYDLASLRELSIDEAFTKIMSGLSGESEPLKRLGYVINETTTKQFAYANGIAKTGKALTEMQKVQARYRQIMLLTIAAHNDLADTADEPANRIRLLKEEFKTLSKDVGDNIIKSKSFQNTLIGLSNLMKKMSPVIQGLVKKGFDKLDAFFANSKNIEYIQKAFLKTANALKLVGKGISLVADKTTVWLSKAENIKAITKVLNLVEGGFRHVSDETKKWLSKAENIKDFKKAFKTIIAYIKDIGGYLKDTFGDDEARIDFINGLYRMGDIIRSVAIVVNFLWVALNKINNVIFLVTDNITRLVTWIHSGSEETKIFYQNIIKAIIYLTQFSGIMFALRHPFEALKTVGKVFSWLAKIILSPIKSIAALTSRIALLGTFLKSSLGIVSTLAPGVIAYFAAIAAVVGWLAGKGLVKFNNWLVKNVEWVGKLQDKLDGLLVWVLNILPLWKKLFGIKEKSIEQIQAGRKKAEQIRSQRRQQATVPTPASLSNAYTNNGTGDKAMLAKMDALIMAINSQPQKQIQLAKTYG